MTKSTSTRTPIQSATLENGLTLSVQPSHSTLRRGKGNARQIMITLRAADQDNGAKAPLNIGIALDISGSMSGRPLNEAKKAVLGFSRLLSPNDRLSLVTYSDEAHVAVASMGADRATKELMERLPRIQSQGMTALHAGWLCAAGDIAPFAGGKTLSKVILVTDGQANVGKTHPAELEPDAAELLDAGISLSTYGIGNGFNEQLATALAEAGGGLSKYAEEADALLGHMAEEITMLRHAVARDIRLSARWITEAGDDKQATILNGQDGAFRAPLALHGADNWAIAEVSGNATGKWAQLAVTAEWTDPDGERKAHMVTFDVKTGVRDGKPDSLVDARIAEITAAKEAEKAAAFVAAGNYQAANAVVNHMAGLGLRSSYAGEIHANLAATLSSGDMAAMVKEAHYSASSLRTRVADCDEDAMTATAGRYGQRRAKQGRSGEDA